MNPPVLGDSKAAKKLRAFKENHQGGTINIHGLNFVWSNRKRMVTEIFDLFKEEELDTMKVDPYFNKKLKELEVDQVTSKHAFDIWVVTYYPTYITDLQAWKRFDFAEAEKARQVSNNNNPNRNNNNNDNTDDEYILQPLNIRDNESYFSESPAHSPSRSKSPHRNRHRHSSHHRRSRHSHHRSSKHRSHRYRRNYDHNNNNNNNNNNNGSTFSRSRSRSHSAHHSSEYVN